jgi:CubicO group peptidase (beta-lactamase class C family)
MSNNLIHIAELDRRVTATVTADIAAGKIGCAAAALVDAQGIKFERYYRGDERFPVTENTLFRLASMTKPITAVAVMLLVEAGQLSLDDEVCKFLPAYAEMWVGRREGNRLERLYKAEPITIRQLLSHASGLGSGDVGNLADAQRPEEALRDLASGVDYYATVPLDFAPASAHAYSAVFGFDVLARVVEVVAGTTFDKFLKTEIFDKLGMTDTTFAPTDEQWARLVAMHTVKDGAVQVAPMTPNAIFFSIPTTYFCGGAGLAGTMRDYTRFARMLIGRGTLDGKQLLKEETVALMATPQITACNQPDAPDVWGLGMRVVQRNKYLPVGSYGWSGAFGTHFWIDPVNELSGLYMKNSRVDGGAGASTSRTFERDVYESME